MVVEETLDDNLRTSYLNLALPQLLIASLNELC